MTNKDALNKAFNKGYEKGFEEGYKAALSEITDLHNKIDEALNILNDITKEDGGNNEQGRNY